MSKFISTSLLSISCYALNSCSLVTVPVKVAGKAATTSLGLAGKVAGAGVDLVTPNGEETEEE